MQNPAFNPMRRENFRFRDDAAPLRGGESGDLDAIAAAQDGLLNEALAIGHAPSIAAALGLIARMRGMSALAAATGIGRQSLYRTLRAEGNPTLDTLTRMTSAVGYRRSAARQRGGVA